MRIISKFKDYYDTAMGLGIDADLIYRREIQELEIPDWPYEQKVKQFFEIPEAHMFRLEQPLAFIGFCGRMYPYWLDIAFLPSKASLASQTKQKVWVSDEEMIRQHLSANRPSRQDIDEEAAQDIAKEMRSFHGVDLERRSFREFKCPTYLVLQERWPGKYRIFTNPRLANFDFMKVIEPYTAFQEIAMFLGSELAVEDKAARTSGDDEIIAAAKGFDEQSFRTLAPGRKKLNRQSNKQRKKGRKDELG